MERTEDQGAGRPNAPLFRACVPYLVGFGCFHTLGVLSVGVLTRRALLSGV